jgi:hypothetical protein
MSRLTKWLVAANLLVITALVFIQAPLMVSPGPLIAAHRALEGDCFACHAPLRGTTAQRCASCHAHADIGLVTTAGAPIVRKAGAAPPFHQQLVVRDCSACHADHAGVTRYRQAHGFDHDLLQAALRSRCDSCHQPPQDALHRNVGGAAGAGCGQCHSVDAWRPAQFAHERWFLLDAEHNARCDTCHVGNDFKRYTCYGCHEHTPAGIRSEHVEEGISDIRDCVRCHRNAREGSERGGKRDGGARAGGDDD